MKAVQAIRIDSPTYRVQGAEAADAPPKQHPEVGVLANMGPSERASVFQDLLEEMGLAGGLVPVRLDFSIHQPTGRMVVNVTNRETGEVLKSLPPENLLNALTRMMEYIGLVMDERI
ncbi:MAG: flagellar protein FlaG [Bacillota bacterium]